MPAQVSKADLLAGAAYRSGSGYRLATGGLASYRRAVKASSSSPSTQEWEPILPQGLAGSRPVRLLTRLVCDPPKPRLSGGWAWAQKAKIPQTIGMCVAGAAICTLALYWGKSRAAVIDGQITRVIQASQAARARTSLLRAEWALLNDPDRLRAMATHYLSLHPLEPGQYAEVSALSTRLPAVAAPPNADAEPEEPDHTPVSVIAQAAAPQTMPAEAAAHALAEPTPPVPKVERTVQADRTAVAPEMARPEPTAQVVNPTPDTAPALTLPDVADARRWPDTARVQTPRDTLRAQASDTAQAQLPPDAARAQPLPDTAHMQPPADTGQVQPVPPPNLPRLLAPIGRPAPLAPVREAAAPRLLAANGGKAMRFAGRPPSAQSPALPTLLTHAAAAPKPAKPAIVADLSTYPHHTSAPPPVIFAHSGVWRVAVRMRSSPMPLHPEAAPHAVQVLASIRPELPRWLTEMHDQPAPRLAHHAARQMSEQPHFLEVPRTRADSEPAVPPEAAPKPPSANAEPPSNTAPDTTQAAETPAAREPERFAYSPPPYMNRPSYPGSYGRYYDAYQQPYYPPPPPPNPDNYDYR